MRIFMRQNKTVELGSSSMVYRAGYYFDVPDELAQELLADGHASEGAPETNPSLSSGVLAAMAEGVVPGSDGSVMYPATNKYTGRPHDYVPAPEAPVAQEILQTTEQSQQVATEEAGESASSGPAAEEPEAKPVRRKRGGVAGDEAAGS